MAEILGQSIVDFELGPGEKLGNGLNSAREVSEEKLKEDFASGWELYIHQVIKINEIRYTVIFDIYKM